MTIRPAFITPDWKHLNPGARIASLFMILFIGLVAAFWGVWTNSLAPVSTKDQGVTIITISPGSSLKTIADLLEQRGIIKSSWAFQLLGRVNGWGSKLQAGTYALSPSEDTTSILGKLAQGKVAQRSFTIPEGLTVVQIADRLSQQGLINRDRFLAEAANGKFDFPYINNAISGPERLEGYLFPDTYTIPFNANEHDIIQIMLEEFKAVYGPKEQKRTQELGLTPNQVVTIASLVEKEAKNDAERSLIASVFYNRMARHMPLQSCATIQYILGHPKEVLTYKDLAIPSPYNTYLHNGLPPGPIACPGKKSLLAALYPDNSPYLYFVARGDGTHHFSTTLKEHLQAKAAIEGKQD